MSKSTAQSLAAALPYLPNPPSSFMPNLKLPEPSMCRYHGPSSDVKGSTETAKKAIRSPDRLYNWQQPNMGDAEVIKIRSPGDKQTITSHSLTVSAPNAAQRILDSPTLPSLLQYVDNDLLRRRSEHNNPQSQNAFCSVCGLLYYAPTVGSTYFPLTCGCWMHYRCFVGHVANASNNRRGHKKDCCPACGNHLFIWEGIAALTLAIRTDVPMENVTFPFYETYVDESTGHHIISNKTAYESDCALIYALIQKNFFRLFQPDASASRYKDGSPDLTACYYTVLGDLDTYGRPKAKWLTFERTGAEDGSVGFFLFGMLVALKMRGFLNEYHSAIVETEAWADFENVREELQGRILKDVRGSGWSWKDTAST